KIRSYHLLRHLSEHYNVLLGTFIDDPHDRHYVPKVERWCRAGFFGTLNPRIARLRCLPALLTNRPLSLDYYRDRAMSEWVTRQVRHHVIRRVMVFSSQMAQYAELARGARVVVDFCDVDSEKWRAYARAKPLASRWLYAREGRTLLDYERQVAGRAHAALFVSASEADLFRCLAPECAAKTAFCENGVDAHYFSPARCYDHPFAKGRKAVVFCGAMDYWPNAQAVRWFVHKVFPALRCAHPEAVFWIVGARPGPAVSTLARVDGVQVTGAVPDVRPYLAHADVSVAPLKIARGIQNKVLEAMAMARPVVATPQAAEGIDAQPGRHILLAQGADAFAQAVASVLAGGDAGMGERARAFVLEHHSWPAKLGLVRRLLEAQDGTR
ncbi:MAG TPA: TIGR03087 family PEP-CTERM/XrtA system glycosyltransferase, partial [Telluria sp.]|nr:TIGR03087 family PEP-CTERM/XrtA system glycosyltransferase [Telluria sp.]